MKHSPERLKKKSCKMLERLRQYSPLVLSLVYLFLQIGIDLNSDKLKLLEQIFFCICFPKILNDK